jgi:hypothetical protein
MAVSGADSRAGVTFFEIFFDSLKKQVQRHSVVVEHHEVIA